MGYSGITLRLLWDHFGYTYVTTLGVLYYGEILRLPYNCFGGYQVPLGYFDGNLVVALRVLWEYFIGTLGVDWGHFVGTLESLRR